MKPAPFDYQSASTIDHAIDVLREHGDEAKVLAGGQSLVPMMAFRLARPSVLLDINRVRRARSDRRRGEHTSDWRSHPPREV